MSQIVFPIIQSEVQEICWTGVKQLLFQNVLNFFPIQLLCSVNCMDTFATMFKLPEKEVYRKK